jgi:hypothetical protein
MATDGSSVWEARCAPRHGSSSPIISNATAYAGTPVVTPIDYVAEASGDAVIASAGVKFKF